MQSMIKRDISLSITAHSELIRQLILDGLEVAEFRKETFASKGVYRLKGDAIYYRNMRQNGHSTALRTVYASQEFENVNIMSVFIDGTQQKAFSATMNSNNSKAQPSQLQTETIIKRNPDCLRGLNPDVLILNDYISTGWLDRGWAMAEKVHEHCPNIKLVVFLG